MSSEQKPEKPIPISWVSTEDLIRCQPQRTEQIQALNPADVEYLAEKVGDALQDSYWQAMESVLDDFFNEKAVDEF